ncbi:MAG TPA: hypothetical protein VFW94_23750 [Candidatus Acidoferrales bacterium]|nr:hypothetical protein [Candidatus Acidoferrales bacterium]
MKHQQKPRGRLRPDCHRSTVEKHIAALMQEVNFVVGPRVSDCHNPTSGSKQFKCADCGQWVWLSPTTLSFNLKVPIVCQPCAVVKCEAADEQGETVSGVRFRNGKIEEGSYRR